MTTKRLKKADINEAAASPRERREGRAELALRLKEAKSRAKVLRRQIAMCGVVESIEDDLSALEGKVHGIGALARDHDQAQTKLATVEQDLPSVTASARAVFAIMPHADRHGPLLKELSEAVRHRDEERKVLEEATAVLAREREIFDTTATTRVGWPGRRRPNVDSDAQWAVVQRLAVEVHARTASTQKAESVWQRLSEEAASIDRKLAVFQREQGGHPADVYARVEAHRREIRLLRERVQQLGLAVAERRVGLEQTLRNRLEQLEKWGLASTVPDGAEAMVSAMQQSYEVAALKTSHLDCGELEIEAENVARVVMELAGRVYRVDLQPGSKAAGLPAT